MLGVLGRSHLAPAWFACGRVSPACWTCWAGATSPTCWRVSYILGWWCTGAWLPHVGSPAPGMGESPSQRVPAQYLPHMPMRFLCAGLLGEGLLGLLLARGSLSKLPSMYKSLIRIYAGFLPIARGIPPTYVVRPWLVCHLSLFPRLSKMRSYQLLPTLS